MTNPVLTRRQQQLLDHLRTRASDAPAPSLDQLCRELGLRSRGSLHKHVQALIEAGLVEPLRGRHRGVRLTTPTPGTDNEGLPLLGRIAAGQPIEAIEQAERIEVPAQLRGRGTCYVLEVRGESMIGEGILDGDWVVIEQRDQARNGEIVVALIDDTQATLKRIEQKPGQVCLHAANPEVASLCLAPGRVRIQGVLVGQMRRYST